MQPTEYRVEPAPRRGTKAKGLKTTEDRFAAALTAKLNEMAAEGWDYLRADTLPCDERSGIAGRSTTYHSVLIFGRAKADEPKAEAPAALAAPEASPPAALPAAESDAPKSAE